MTGACASRSIPSMRGQPHRSTTRKTLACPRPAPCLRKTRCRRQRFGVEFLAVDQSEQHETGVAERWDNELKLRCRLDENGAQREVELIVVPRGDVFYTLDGSEPREGTPYEGKAIPINDDGVAIQAFAVADSREIRKEFRFPAKGTPGGHINEGQPARLVSGSGHTLDSRAATFEGLALAAERSVSFENVTINIGQGKDFAAIMFGEAPMDAAFLDGLLKDVLDKFSLDAPVTLGFQKAHFQSGHDLREFCKTLKIAFTPEDVEQ